MQKLRLSMIAISALATAGIANTASAADYDIAITNITRGIHFTPLIAAAHDPAARMFSLGTTASAEMQAIAEGGDIQGMSALLSSIGAQVSADDGLLAPGQSVTLSLSDAAPGSVLSLSAMLLPTNDGFVGIDSATLPTGSGVSTTLFARGYDAGSEANDELVGGGAPGVPGFPAPPPVVATGTGTGASGIDTTAEGFVHIHPGVLGDLDATGGVSDINAAVHRFQNPVARVVITRTDAGGNTTTGDPTAVNNLTGSVYSSSAVEIFWEPAVSESSTVAAYRVLRDGAPVATLDGLSFFDQGLSAGTDYVYSVSAVDASGVEGAAQTVSLSTNGQ